MKRLTDDDASTHYNVLIYGPPGSGKTSFGVSAPDPVLHLLTEMNGKPHILGAAKRLKKARPEIFFIERTDDLNAVLAALYSDPSKPFVLGGREMARPRTVVVDQVSDLGRLFSDEHDKKFPPRDGKDGLPLRAMNSWNKLADTMRKFIKAFRDAPCHTVFLAEFVDTMKGEEDAKYRFAGPVMPMNQLVPALVHAVSVVGTTYRTYTSQIDPITKNRIISYGVNLHAPQYQVSKILRPLNDVEVPDFASWVRRLEGAIEDVRLPEPPDEMKEGLVTEPKQQEEQPKQQEE